MSYQRGRQKGRCFLILFFLCELPFPPPPNDAAALRSPVDHRGTHPQQVGDGTASVAADLQGKVDKALSGTRHTLSQKMGRRSSPRTITWCKIPGASRRACRGISTSYHNAVSEATSPSIDLVVDLV